MTSAKRVAWGDLDAAEQAWFASHAAAALARRGPRFFSALRARCHGWILTGATGLLGLWLFDWSALTALLLLLATFWLGWLSDVLLRVLRAAQLPRAYAVEHEDARFWQIVELLRGTRRAPPDARGGTPLLLSVIVDLVAGIAAVTLLLRGLHAAGTACARLWRRRRSGWPSQPC